MPDGLEIVACRTAKERKPQFEDRPFARVEKNLHRVVLTLLDYGIRDIVFNYLSGKGVNIMEDFK